MKIPQNGFTHGGVFHADDVFSTALLQILRPDFLVLRGFSVPENFDGIVYDIGGGIFDHHQTPREMRENGIPYAAFGKLWKKFGAEFVGDATIAAEFDERFVQPLDESDNTGKQCSLSEAIAVFNPVWNEHREDAEVHAFKSAVSVAKEVLLHEFQKMQAEKEAKSIVEKAMKEASSESHVLILNEYIPAIRMLIDTEFCFCVFPSQRGGWNAQVVPESKDSQKAKVDFPHSWWGASVNDLPPKVTFCHASGFLLAADTKEAALAACEMALHQ